MCGIAGIKGFDNRFSVHDLEKMGNTFPWRGPDDKGVFFDQARGIGLAHRRLSIIDTSAAGVQPMFDSDRQLVIVFNGEIYNYLELRKELEGLGAVFHTKTDTEVILAAYKRWGIHCLDRFNGMWAFAIYDIRNRSLFMARDRMGIKPFYYYRDDQGIFYFASEVKAILSALDQVPDLDLSGLDPYMSFGYLPGEDTLFKGIRRLLPGHYMTLDSDNLLKTGRYWDLNFSVGPDKGLDYYVENGRELLNSAIDLRLRSDVPLGIFLSGGLDSSSIVGLLASRVSQPLKTFSVAYDLGRQFNETPWARQVAETFQTDHHEFFVTPEQFSDFIPDFIRYMDEPVTESAAISLYYIARLAKTHVTVALSGEGADEILGGYDFYRYMAVLDIWYKTAGPAGSRLIAGIGQKLLPGAAKLNKYLALGAMPLAQRYKGISTYGESLKSSLYKPELKGFLERKQNSRVNGFLKDLFARTEGEKPLNRMLYFDTKTWLPDDLLIKADRMSMAASIELRVPFLDYRLVEFCASLPIKYKINRGIHKYLLKQIMKPILPREIINRKKMGFPTPLQSMFKGPLSDYARDVLTGPSCMLHNYFEPMVIQKILADHKNGHLDFHREIWQLIVLEVWMQTWIKKDLPHV